MSLEAMTLDQWNKYVEESNEKFLAASRAEKRVMLAEDVLKQLKSERIRPISKYLMLHRDTDVHTDRELRDVLKEEPKCHVCGIGALFVSAVGRLDKLSTLAFFDAGEPQHAVHNYMGAHDLFDRSELEIIEYFFENNWTSLAKATHMEIIMRAIIDTKGAAIEEPFKLRLWDDVEKLRNTPPPSSDLPQEETASGN